MASINSLKKSYDQLGERFENRCSSDIDPRYLLAFDYEHYGQTAEVMIDTEEFTAVCPWTDLPDFGTLKVTYLPDKLCLELKSLKYYLMSYSHVKIVQEHAANRILKDLVEACQPVNMTVNLDYKVRGGIHTTVTVSHGQS